MITAILYREGNNLTGCQIKGHSGWAESGNDIVCAAASILGCTCVNALESVCGIYAVVTQNDDGILAFDLPDKDKENEKGQILMRALEQGLKDLSSERPKHVRLSIIERRK